MKVNLKKLFPYVVILFTSLILLQFQIEAHATMIYNDTVFHFNRFQALADQIKTGNFSYFAVAPTGRVLNALYGPFFAYLNALLLLITGTYFRYQIISDIILFLVAGIGMYKLALKARISSKWALILSLVFLNVGNVPVWITGSSVMSWGAAVVPYVYIEAVNMMQDHDYPIRWIRLALALAVLTQIHMLSTLLTIVSLIPIVIIAFVQAVYKKQMIIDLLKAVGLYILLTANYWGSFIVLYSKNRISPPVPGDLTFGVHFSKFGSVARSVDIVMILLLIFQLIYVLVHFKKNILNSTVTIVGAIFFISTTKLFPWKYISEHFPVLQTTFQMPHRLLVVAYPLLLLGVGLTLMELSKTHENATLLLKGWIILVLVQSFIPNAINNYQYTQNYLNKKTVVEPAWYYKVTPDRAAIQAATHSRNREEFLKLVVNNEPDYLPLRKKIDFVKVEKLFAKDVLQNQDKFKTTLWKNGTIKLTWQSTGHKQTTLPVVMYAQSELKVNNKNIAHPHLSDIGVPTINSKKGSNTAILIFNEPVYFKVLLWISIVSWCIIAVYGVYRLRKPTRRYYHNL